MTNYDFSKHLFRCSQLPILMKKSKKTGELSETTKSLLDEIYIEKVFLRKKIIVSKYLEKGNKKENESISLYRKLTQVFCKKNDEVYQNNYLIGTPDLILDYTVIDIKTCWDIFTFFKKDEKSAHDDYYWQLYAYAWLCDKSSMQLAYCLVDNDEFTIFDEFKKIKYGLGLDDESPELSEIEAQLVTNNQYTDLKINQKIKIYNFEFDKKLKEQVVKQLKLCREYLNNLQF